LVSRKVDLAKNLLKIGYLSISDIASMSGYENIYYFSRVFKESTGMTPTEYRKNLKVLT
jgi:two-component system response regulator YesN